MPNAFEKFVRPLLFGLPAETAHEIGIESLRVALGTAASRSAARRRYPLDPSLRVERFGLEFSSPLGMAAGFDKNGIVVNQLSSLGFGFVEVGTVTLRPQKGNEKPRLFRLPEDKALINRLGFNNQGSQAVAQRLRKLEPECIVGVNIGKNRDVPIEDAIADYVSCLEVVHDVADYLVVNVSSPNTPNLRELQEPEQLRELVRKLRETNKRLGSKPLLVKIAPDLDLEQIESIVDIARQNEIAGVIATNTTISREGLQTKGLDEIGNGGLSGSPLRERSTQVIAAIYRYSNGKLPIIGVGGIFTAEDAFEKIVAGACLLQAYTGFIYCGPSFASGVNMGLAKILKQRGFTSVDEAVGCGEVLSSGRVLI